MKLKRITILRIIGISTGITTAIIFVPWTAVFAWLTPLPDTVDEQLEYAVKKGLDGIMVYVDQAGHEPEFYAAGYNDRDLQTPANPHALFKIASISKLYTVAAAVKLAHSQRLALDSSLAHYLPELTNRIEYANGITLRMMIGHRSGIPNFTDAETFWANPPTTAQGMLDLVLDQPALFEPDADSAYCNTNYLLLRRIMDRTLGYDHFEYIDAEILQPLGLTNTHATPTPELMDDLSSGYHVGYEPNLKESAHNSMVATAEDVGIFVRALKDGTLFSPEEQATYSAIYKYSHTGWLLGYMSWAKHYPEQDMVVVQFVNTTGDDNTWLLANINFNRIAKILHRQQQEKAVQP